MHSERTRIRVPVIAFDARLTDSFGLQVAVTVPDITRTAAISSPTGVFNFKENFRGIGDTSVLGWYRPRHPPWNIVVNFGFSLPTGNTERPRFRPELEGGDLVPTSRLQRGSGTMDPLFGASAGRQVRGGFILFSSLAVRAPFKENSEGLRTGFSSELNGGVARLVRSNHVVAFAKLGWVRRAQDVFRGTPVLVGGGNWLYLTPGLGIEVAKNMNVEAEFKFLIHRSLANKQLDSSRVFQVGLSKAF